MSEHEIPLSRPDISALEEELLILTLRSGRLSIGPMQLEFERLVADRAGCEHGVAVSSGTAGLHLALLALGIGPGDEVITTPFSFIASANAIRYVGATPVFVDICPMSLNADPAKIEAAVTERTAGVMAVECFGNPAFMDEYAKICAKHEIPLIEDCCEALGTTHRGRPCGSFGRVGVFGFYPNKQITTGEGGMIVTKDTRLADMCRSLRNQGRGLAPQGGDSDNTGQANTGSWLSHPHLGYNYRLSELSAALGVAQMRRFDRIVTKRQIIADRYIQRLSAIPDIVLPTIPDGCDMSWFVFVVRLGPEYTCEQRDRIIRGLRNHEIGCAPYFPCIHLQPPYAALPPGPGGLPIAESVAGRTIALPFHSKMTEREIDLVAQTLELMIAREKLLLDDPMEG